MGASSKSSREKAGKDVDLDALVSRVLRALPDPVLVCKAGGRIVLANPAVHALLGYDDGALVGRKVAKILPQDFRDPDREPDSGELASHGGLPPEAVPARRSDGGLVPVGVSLATIPGIGRPLSVAVLRLLGETGATEGEGGDGGEGAAGAGPDDADDTDAAADAAKNGDRDGDEDEGVDDRTAAELHRLRTELADLRARLALSDHRAEVVRAELERSGADLAASRVELEATRSGLEEARAGRDRATSELVGTRRQLARARSDLEITQADLARARAAAGTAAATSSSPPTPPPPLPPPAADQAAPDLYDPLTELPRRPLLHDNLERALARTARDGGLAGVLMVDVDRFGELDHAYGRPVSEQLLTSVATRLAGAVGPDDVLARMRSDEFALLHVSERDDVAEFTDLADRIAVALDPPFRVGEVALEISASIGISVGAAGSGTAEEMLREADVAVARARGEGGGRAELFDQELRLQARRRLDQAAALRRAIDDEELLVLWQAAHPLGATDDAEVWAEALVRWQNPDRGMVSASNFIRLAEETGLIVPIGRFVLRNACHQLARWRELGSPHPAHVSVNLSARELAQDDLVTEVSRVLEDAGVEPACLTLEITESVVAAGATGSEAAMRRLAELSGLGVRLAMDDFGTGDSSLDLLRRLPLSVLKIDRSFVAGVATNRPDWAIVRGLVEIGHSLGLTVVAEGIENRDQLDTLVTLGCDRGQGYLWGSPVPVDQLDAQLAEQVPRTA